MRLVRLIWFILSIVAGVGIGLAYGWLVKPAGYAGTQPATLRIDYKTDYVLMVAEAYNSDADISQAERRLAMLGNTPPVETVYQAVLFAQKVGSLDRDIQLMQALMNALQPNAVAQGTPPP